MKKIEHQLALILVAVTLATVGWGCESGHAATDAGGTDGSADAHSSGDAAPDMHVLPDLGGDTGTGMDLGADLGTDASLDGGTPDMPPSCAPVALHCGSTPITGTTTLPSYIDTYGDCGSGDGYDRDEALFTFVAGSTVTGTTAVTISTTSTSGVDYDLFVVNGGATACDSTGTCAGESRGGTGDESVTFAASPTASFLVGFDRFDTDPGTSDYTITVDCVALVCGDGIIAGGGLEECDDGNSMAGDGCSATCTIETGFDCTGEPSVCTPLCGNGVLDGTEACDDGNTTGADGCTACMVDAGHACSGEPSVCVPVVCGDGILAPGETCDDHNVVPADGCDAMCRDEAFTAIAGIGASVMLSGSIVDTLPHYSRDFQDCSSAAHDTYFQTFVIENTSAIAQTIDLTAAWSAGRDGYLFVYTPPFDPTMPVNQCLSGDDDFGTDGSQILDVMIAPGQQLIVVATAFDDLDAIGPFTITVATH